MCLWKLRDTCWISFCVSILRIFYEQAQRATMKLDWGEIRCLIQAAHADQDKGQVCMCWRVFQHMYQVLLATGLLSAFFQLVHGWRFYLRTKDSEERGYILCCLVLGSSCNGLFFIFLQMQQIPWEPARVCNCFWSTGHRASGDHPWDHAGLRALVLQGVHQLLHLPSLLGRKMA